MTTPSLDAIVTELAARSISWNRMRQAHRRGPREREAGVRTRMPHGSVRRRGPAARSGRDRARPAGRRGASVVGPRSRGGRPRGCAPACQPLDDEPSRQGRRELGHRRPRRPHAARHDHARHLHPRIAARLSAPRRARGGDLPRARRELLPAARTRPLGPGRGEHRGPHRPRPFPERHGQGRACTTRSRTPTGPGRTPCRTRSTATWKIRCTTIWSPTRPCARSTSSPTWSYAFAESGGRRRILVPPISTAHSRDDRRNPRGPIRATADTDLPSVVEESLSLRAPPVAERSLVEFDEIALRAATRARCARSRRAVPPAL